MSGRTRVSIVHYRALNQTVLFVARAPAQARLPPHVYLRAVCSALRMSQAQLAQRSGIPQAHIARLERGRTPAKVSTLARLYDAMFCDLLVLPRPRQRLGDALSDLRLELRPWHPIARPDWRPDRGAGRRQTLM